MCVLMSGMVCGEGVLRCCLCLLCVCVFVCCLPSVCVKREEKRAKSKAKAKSSESDDLHWLFPTRRSTQSGKGSGRVDRRTRRRVTFAPIDAAFLKIEISTIFYGKINVEDYITLLYTT